MVGGGFLKPEPTKARKDTPKAFKQLLVRCCQFKAEDRPLFPQVRRGCGHETLTKLVCALEGGKMDYKVTERVV